MRTKTVGDRRSTSTRQKEPVVMSDVRWLLLAVLSLLAFRALVAGCERLR
jgi:hypothetical protein